MTFVFFFLLIVSASASEESLTLKRYLEQVLKANPSVEAAKLRALAEKHRIMPSGTLEDPFVAYGIDDIPFEGGKGRVRRYQISQSLPFPGKLKARERAVEKKAQAAESDAETLKRRIKVIAIQSFLKASYNLQAIKLNNKIQKIIQETAASAKARYKTGGATHHDWLLGKLELAMLEVENLRLNRLQQTLHALLNELRNVSPETVIKLDFNESELTEEEPPEVKIEEQPELLASRLLQKGLDAELKFAQLSYAPDFVIQAMAMEPTMSEGEMAGESNWGVMVGFTIPLFFWRKQNELVAAASSEQRALRAEVQSLNNRLKTEIAEAQEQFKTAMDVISLYQKNVIPLTELAVKNARSAYGAKTLPLGQLLDALRSQKTQELELVAAKMDAFVAQTRLKELLSNPPVTRFAPARPTLFGGGGMGTTMSDQSMEGSTTINLGNGISRPSGKESREGSSEAMGGMGGM